ncbi:uncharacterized protein LOC134278892 [Saccostrea cucullata]|uniref:uncharacterized protein LOC134278892 n=1 Tax=Saccostrea cuccullata TaxID=36930 RepID=UPI002ED5DB95
MNDAISELRKRGKKKSKIEQLLLVDHSNIYFENERLAERLAKFLDELHKDKHRQEMVRNIEIQELKREIDNLQAMKDASSAQTKKFLQTLENYYTSSAIPKPEKKTRPHTTGSYFKKSRAKSEERERTEKPKSKTRAVSASRHEESVSEKEFERAKKREKRAPADDTKTDDQSEGDKKSRTLKYPEDWYTTVLPASDNCLKKIRQQYRREQTAPTITLSKRSKKSDKSKDSAKPQTSTATGQRGLSREKTEDMKQRSGVNTAGNRKNSVATEVSKSDIDEEIESKSRIKMVCQQKSKPVMMSLRQMRELTGMDGNNDNMPNKRQERLDKQIQETKVKFLSLTQRVKTFVKELDEKIAQDLEDSKPKENESHDDMYSGILPPDQDAVPT